MNVTKYILAAATIFATACNDTEYIEAPQLPVKSVLVYNKGFEDYIDVFTINNAVAVLQNAEQNYISLVIINPDGTTSLSEPIPRFDEMNGDEVAMKFSREHVQNNRGEVFFYGMPVDEEEPKLKVAKLNHEGKLIYNHVYDNVFHVYGAAACDDGSFVFFCKDYYEHSDSERYVMRVIDQNGELRNYMIVLDIDILPNIEYFDLCLCFDDRIFIAKDEKYFVLKMDGTFLKTGTFPGYCVYYVKGKYADGAFYFLSIEDVWAENYFSFQYYVHKIDVDGNLLFSKTFDVNEPSTNITIDNEKLIVSGKKPRADNYDDYLGRIWVFDKNNGNLTDSVTLNYDGNIMPRIILPAKNGGYDVFLTRIKASDKWLKEENLPIYIYHTDYLHDINVEN